jgi:hypothetical protein
MESTIIWNNNHQHAIWKVFIIDNIVDGIWTEQKIPNHWELPYNCKSMVNTGNLMVGTNFKPLTYYNFNNKEFLQNYDKQIINFIKMVSVFPELKIDIPHLFRQRKINILLHEHKYITGFLSDIDFWTNSHKAKYRDKTFDIYETFNIEHGDLNALTNKLLAIDNIKFTKKELINTLIEMNKIYKTYNGTHEQNIQKKSNRQSKPTKTKSAKPKNKTQETNI